MATNVIELKAKKKKIVVKMRSMIDLAETEKRSMTDEEDKTYQEHQKELDDVTKQIETEQRMEDRKASLSREEEDLKRVDKPFYSYVNVSDETRISKTGAEYRSVHYPDDPDRQFSTDGFRSIGGYFVAVASGRDAKLKDAAVEFRENFAGVGAWGGFAIPPGYNEFMLDHALLADEIVRPLAMNLTMETPEISVPMFDGYDRSSGIFGVRLKMYGEGVTIDEQTPLLRSQNIRAKKGIVDWAESRELVQDSPGFNSKLTTLLPRAIARDLDRLFLFGNNVTEPAGVRDHASTLGVARNTSASILYADVKGLWKKLHPACHKNCVWVINSTNIDQLLALKDDANRAIWQPGMGGNIKDGVPQTLFGRPIHFCEDSPALGELGDIMLVDLTQYICAFRQEMTVETSNAPNWSRDMVNFRISLRFNGVPVFANPITLANGDFVSWAAVLNA